MNPSRVELESKVAFLERTVEDLNEVILAQGSALDDLERRLAVLELRQGAGQELESPPTDPMDERPPHY